MPNTKVKELGNLWVPTQHANETPGTYQGNVCAFWIRWVLHFNKVTGTIQYMGVHYGTNARLLVHYFRDICNEKRMR